MTVIRPERPDDAAAIEDLVRAAFVEAPHTDGNEHLIVARLRAHGALSVSLVAEDDGRIVGHIAASPVDMADGTQGWFGIGPVSVSPDRQGAGIGSQLVRRTLEALRALDAAGCVVLGDSGYYGRFGFAPRAGLLLADVPAEYFQAVVFRHPQPLGHVTYHAAFYPAD